MKKILLTLVFLFILAIGYSQNSDYKKNEISIGIINLTESPKNQEKLFENSFYLTPFSNLTYKRFINKNNAIRLIYYRPITKSYDKSGGEWSDKGEYKEQVLKIGYEYIFKHKKLTPYIAIDFTHLKSSFSSIIGGGITGETFKYEENKNGIGLAPTIGLNYKIYKNFFIGLESNLNILYLKDEKVSTQSFPKTSEVTNKKTSDSFEYIFNPVVFLVRFRF